MNSSNLSQTVELCQSYEAASIHVQAITQCDPETTIIDVRMIHDSNRGVPAIPMRGVLPQLWPSITTWQAQGYGCFININDMDGNGHIAENVRACRVHVIDLDDMSAEQNLQRAIAHSPAPQFYVQTSPGRFHVYWRLAQFYTGNDYYSMIQRKLRQWYQGDKSVVDPTRVLRLAGTFHLKNPAQPYLVTCYALPAFHTLTPHAALDASLAHINVIDGGSGTRHPLGDPALSAPSLAYVQRVLDLTDPNTERDEWVSFTSAIKQAGWLHADEPTLRAAWDAWCVRYDGNNPAENDKLWRSIRDTEVGWPALLRRRPELVMDKYAGIVMQEPIAGTVLPPAPDFWATVKADDTGKTTALVTTKTIVDMGIPVALDEFADKIMILSRVPWDDGSATYPHEWTDNDTHGAKTLLEAAFIKPSKETVYDSIRYVARRNRYHPVRDYLNHLKWDGVSRLPGLAATYFGAEHNAYVEAVGTKFMISAVARVMKPGCQVDTMLILEGEQGLLKSSGLRELVGDDWFTDQLPDVDSKDSSIQLQGKWVIELGELSTMNRAEVTAMKAYASRRIDRYRPPYGRAAVDLPRQCVFTATTNEDEYLRDQTGNRRYWPIKCGKVDVNAVRRDRDQLWAEAMARFKLGDQWWLTADQEKLARQEQDARRERDPWEDLVANYVQFSTGPITVEQICKAVLEIPFDKYNRGTTGRVADCLKKAGFVRRQVNRQWGYYRKDVGLHH